MTYQPPVESLILVCIVPHPRDLEIARLLGWYRIPLRTAPKVIDVDILAFYQTDAFGTDHRWRISSYAKVRGHELVSRKELFRDQNDHPRANEEYYKIQIGPLCVLDHPILADRWRRITFLYTTGELFQNAERINDLVVRSEERHVLWRTLRERALRTNPYFASELPEDEFFLDPKILSMLGDFGGFSEAKGDYDFD